MRGFRDRAKSPGFKNGALLWGEAAQQTKSGWLEGPRDITSSGDIEIFPKGHSNIAFRFGGCQFGKLRACGDLRRNMVNLATHALKPITLPTWDHIAQIAKDIRNTKFDWVFLKADRKDAYKQLPLDPQYGNLSIVALRRPDSGKWNGFTPKVLLFGAASEVTHYNCFSRAFAVLVNRCCGAPLLSYYGDCGAFCPESLGAKALSTVNEGGDILLILFKKDKSEVGRSVKFLGLPGDFPNPANGMDLCISLPQGKTIRWSEIAESTASKGSIPHKDLGKLLGGLSFSQTSVFGKFGGTMLKSLFGKLR